VLAVLALAEGATVSTAELIDAVWPDEPPPRAREALQSHISRVRTHLAGAADRLQGRDGGYHLALEAGELDVAVARAGLADARRLADDEPAAAVARLASVRALWRGRPLAEHRDVPIVAARTVVLDELRSEVDALLVRCALAAGDTETAVGVAAAAAADDPLSEPATAMHLRALAAAGRPADALRVGDELRRRLRAAGLEPTPGLGALERTIASGAVDPPHPGAGTGWLDPPRRFPAASSVPVLVTALVGRQSEVAAVRRLLAVERLVSVVGPGGVGKTRLVADVVRRHDGDAHYVALAPVTDPAAVPHALAAALGLEAVRGDVLAACIRLLAAGPRLLVLDNCEHVLARVSDAVTALLHACPELTVLTTSRQRLGLPAECTFRLGPLAVPEAAAVRPEESPAVAVFLARARRARPGVAPSAGELALVGDIVRELDGMPLAIELAAGRLSSLTVGDLHERLDRSLDLLQAGSSSADARHRTLRATLDWSYGLLPADRQCLLRHLSVFADGVDLSTAEQVATAIGVDGDPAAVLAELVDSSMLDAVLAGDDGGPPRYRMLETVRSFGIDRLGAAGELVAAEDRLLHWAVELTAWVDEMLHTTAEAAVDAKLRRELANLRAAWTLAMRRGAIDAAAAMIVALDDAAQWRELPEVWHWAQQLARHPALDGHPRAAAVLATASDCAWLQGDLPRAAALAEAAVARSTDDDGWWRAELAIGIVHLSRGEFTLAAERALAAASLAPRPQHARLVAALATAYGGDLAGAAAINEASAPSGGPTMQAEHAYTLAEIASIAGCHADAEGHYRRAIDLAVPVGSSFVVGIASVGLLSVLQATGRHADALRGYREVLTYWAQAGNWIQVWTTLRNLSDLLDDRGDADTARFLRAAADHAPDAPAVGDSVWMHASTAEAGGAPQPDAEIVGRAAAASRHEVLDVAQQAIARHL